MDREELKKFVEQLVKSLAQKGVTVGGGAVMKLGDDGKVESVDSFGSINDIFKNYFNQQQETPKKSIGSLLPPEYKERIKKMSKEEFIAETSAIKDVIEGLIGKIKTKLEQREKGKINPPQPVSEANEEVQEEVSEDIDCTCSSCLNYDNFEEKLTKKGPNFDYAEVTLGGKKFKIKYHVGEGGEENISMRDCSGDVDYKNATTDALQAYLQEAVTDKKFDKAQLILNEIQERKNKN